MMKPGVCSKEMMNFLTKANLGPLVEGKFNKSGQPDPATLKATDKPLISFFEGSSVMTFWMLDYFLAIHLRRSKAFNETGLSASKEMRQMLHGILTKAIRRSAKIEIAKHPDLRICDKYQIVLRVRYLIDNIDHPTRISSEDGVVEIEGKCRVKLFNPNHFEWNQLSGLVPVSLTRKVKLSKPPSKDEIGAKMKKLSLAFVYARSI